MAEAEDKKAEEKKVATSITQLYARPNLEEDDCIEFNDMDVPFKFRRLTWPRYNQIVVDAMNETADTPDHYDRVKQEKLLRAMITEIAGVRMDDEESSAVQWAQLDSAFCETLRAAIFTGTGEMRVSGAMLKNLMPNLEEQIKSTSHTRRKPRL